MLNKTYYYKNRMCGVVRILSPKKEEKNCIIQNKIPFI